MSDNIDRKLWEAAYAGGQRLVSQLIEQGAKVDWRGLNSHTALHQASLLGHTPVVTRLLDAGWSLEARNQYGSTPLALAARNGHLGTVKCLLLRGANIDNQDNDKRTPLHRASIGGYNNIVNVLLQCGANQQIRNNYWNSWNTAEDLAKNDETRAVFSKNKEEGGKSKSELLQQAIVDKNFDVAIILIFREATIEGSDFFEKLIQIAQETQMLDDDHVRALVSRGSDLPGISFRKCIIMLKNTTNVPLIREAIENYLILNIETKDEESGNTPLHAVAFTDNDKVLRLLLNNGASSTQFIKNRKGQIPLEVSKHNKYMFRIILIDFLNHALKSPNFSSDEFQDQLGSGINLFCLKRDFDGNRTLFEFLNEQGLVKEREELIQLLIKMDRFRYKEAEERKRSERRIIKILRAGMKPSKGLQESIDSVQEKYPWGTGKIAWNCIISIMLCFLGCFLYASDIASDFYFYSTLHENDEAARIATFIHIVLPFVLSILIFLTLIFYKFYNLDFYLLLKIPLPPFTKIIKSIIECRSYTNNKRREEADYETSNTKLIQELEDQKNITTISMIIEASVESSFQFLFQGVFSLPTLVFSFMDIQKGTLQINQLVNWKTLSIFFSFLSFAITSFNIRCVK